MAPTSSRNMKNQPSHGRHRHDTKMKDSDPKLNRLDKKRKPVNLPSGLREEEDDDEDWPPKYKKAPPPPKPQKKPAFHPRTGRTQYPSTKPPTLQPEGRVSPERAIDLYDPGWRNSTEGHYAVYERRMRMLFDSLKKDREYMRKKYIREGLLADPDKPTALKDAITIVGTCEDMCPLFERVQRIVEQTVDKYEMVIRPSTGKDVPYEDYMVKRYKRPAAGELPQLPSDIRPPLVLQKTLNYLIEEVISGPEPLLKVHKFVWDRTRGIRNDFSIQQVTELEDVRIAIDCFERTARFHILALHQLSEDTSGDFDTHQEVEQLTKTLVSLGYYYDDNREKIICPNEAEFRSYSIIFDILAPRPPAPPNSRPELELRAQSWPKHVFEDRRVQMALRLYVACDAVEDNKYPLFAGTPFELARATPRSFFITIKSHDVSYLLACVAEKFFFHVQSLILEDIWKAYNKGKSTLAKTPILLEEVMDILGIEKEERCDSFCSSHGIQIKYKDGKRFLDLENGQFKRDRFRPQGQHFSQKIVEVKRGFRTYSEIINDLEPPQEGIEEGIEDLRAAVRESFEPLFVSDYSDEGEMDTSPAQATSKKTDKMPLPAAKLNPITNSSTEPSVSNPLRNTISFGQPSLPTPQTKYSTAVVTGSSNMFGQGPPKFDFFPSKENKDSNTTNGFTRFPAPKENQSVSQPPTDSPGSSTKPSNLLEQRQLSSGTPKKKKHLRDLLLPNPHNSPFKLAAFLTKDLDAQPATSSASNSSHPNTLDTSNQAPNIPEARLPVPVLPQTSSNKQESPLSIPAVGQAFSNKSSTLIPASLVPQPFLNNPTPFISAPIVPQASSNKQESPLSISAVRQVFFNKPSTLIPAPLVPQPSLNQPTPPIPAPIVPQASSNKQESPLSIPAVRQVFFDKPSTLISAPLVSQSFLNKPTSFIPTSIVSQASSNKLEISKASTVKEPSISPSSSLRSSKAIILAAETSQTPSISLTTPSENETSYQASNHFTPIPSTPLGPVSFAKNNAPIGTQPQKLPPTEKPSVLPLPSPPVTQPAPVVSVIPPTQVAKIDPYQSDRRVETVNAISKSIMLDEGGLLQQFLEFHMPNLVKGCVSRVEDERSWEKAKECRAILLSKKYLKRWRENAWKRGLKRRAPERRRRFAQSMQDMARDLARHNQEAELLQSSQKSENIYQKLETEASKEPVLPYSTSLKKRKSPHADVDHHSTPNRASRSKRSRREYVQEELSPSSQYMNSDHASNIVANSKQSETEELINTLVDTQSDYTYLANGSTSSHKILQKIRVLLPVGKLDDTRSDYFLLKSRGIDPDTPVVPRTSKKRHSEEDIRGSSKRQKMSPWKAPAPALSPHSYHPQSRSPSPLSETPYKPQDVTALGRLSDYDETEKGLLAVQRKVNRKMTDLIDWYRTQRAKFGSGRTSTPSSPAPNKSIEWYKEQRAKWGTPRPGSTISPRPESVTDRRLRASEGHYGLRSDGVIHDRKSAARAAIEKRQRELYASMQPGPAGPGCSEGRVQLPLSAIERESSAPRGSSIEDAIEL